MVEFVEHKKPIKYTQINFLISLRLVLQIEKQNTRNYMWLDVVHTVYSLSINNLGEKIRITNKSFLETESASFGYFLSIFYIFH